MKKTFFILAICSLFIISCSRKNESSKAGNQGQAVTAVSPEISEYMVNTNTYGQIVQCPIDLVNFKIDKNTTAVKYKGKVRYFCCPNCKVQYSQNPEKYEPKIK